MPKVTKNFNGCIKIKSTNFWPNVHILLYLPTSTIFVALYYIIAKDIFENMTVYQNFHN